MDSVANTHGLTTRPVRQAPACRRVARRTACLAVALLVATSAGAQTAVSAAPDDNSGATRQSEWEARQARKAIDLQPDEPHGLEAALSRVNIAFAAQRPLHVFVGGVLNGGGIAAGPAYRRVTQRGAVAAHAAWSIRGFRTVEARVDAPSLGGWGAQAWIAGTWLAAPRVPLRALGGTSPARTPTDIEERSGAAGLRLRPWSALTVDADAGVLALRQSRRDAGPAEAVNYLRTRLGIELDTRRARKFSERGGRYRADVADHRGSGPQNFRQVEAEVQQFLPLLRNQWTLALRGLATTTHIDGGQSVPQILLPSLGGQALRGYSAWRFQDRARLLTTAEYRWAAGPHLDYAAFVDAGAVSPRLGAIRLRDLRTSYGVGLILHTPAAARARFDLARSRDGLAVQFSVSPTF